LQGVTNGIGAVLDGMLKRGKGHIVNMSSDAGRRVNALNHAIKD
jgi:NADP-dependent 3-hydroxy acid dehydrogenase YdfG